MRRIILALLTVAVLGNGVAGCALRGSTPDQVAADAAKGAAVGGAIGGPAGAGIASAVWVALGLVIRHYEKRALVRKASTKPRAEA